MSHGELERAIVGATNANGPRAQHRHARALVVALCIASIPFAIGCGGRCREAVAPVGSGKIECHHNAKLKRVDDNWVCSCD